MHCSSTFDFINNSIEPVIEIEEGIKEIISDDGAITRIFSNLLGNMIKHGEKFVKITKKHLKCWNYFGIMYIVNE